MSTLHKASILRMWREREQDHAVTHPDLVHSSALGIPFGAHSTQKVLQDEQNRKRRDFCLQELSVDLRTAPEVMLLAT